MYRSERIGTSGPITGPHYSGDRLLRYVRRAPFPCRRETLIRVALEDGAPSEVLQLARQLPDGQYNSLKAVAYAMDPEFEHQLRPPLAA